MPNSEDLARLLENIHTEIARDLLKKIKSGEATAAELMAAIRFLKDNGISAIRAPGSPLDTLANSVPFPTADDAEYMN